MMLHFVLGVLGGSGGHGPADGGGDQRGQFGGGMCQSSGLVGDDAVGTAVRQGFSVVATGGFGVACSGFSADEGALRQGWRCGLRYGTGLPAGDEPVDLARSTEGSLPVDTGFGAGSAVPVVPGM